MKFKISFHDEHLSLSWDIFKKLFIHIDESYLKSEWEKVNGKVKIKKAKKEGV